MIGVVSMEFSCFRSPWGNLLINDSRLLISLSYLHRAPRKHPEADLKNLHSCSGLFCIAVNQQGWMLWFSKAGITGAEDAADGSFLKK